MRVVALEVWSHPLQRTSCWVYVIFFAYVYGGEVHLSASCPTIHVGTFTETIIRPFLMSKMIVRPFPMQVQRVPNFFGKFFLNIITSFIVCFFSKYYIIFPIHIVQPISLFFIHNFKSTTIL